jgi:hypothetical protein
VGQLYRWVVWSVTSQNCGKGEILFQRIELCELLNLRTVIINGLFRGSKIIKENCETLYRCDIMYMWSFSEF